MNKFYINYNNRQFVDADGSPLSDMPKISYGEKAVWELHFFNAGNEPMNLSEAVAFRAAVDADFDSSTEVMCRTLPENIDASRIAEGILRVRIDALTGRFLEVCSGAETTQVRFELTGLDTNGARVFSCIVPVEACMVLDPETTTDVPTAPGLTADRAWVLALLSSGPELQFAATIDAADDHWTASPDAESRYCRWRFRSTAPGGRWSDPMPLIAAQA
ncbi:MAG: hypothetical protein HPZ91_16685 [Lentisphaeria bacterium]|nr:hypothetical protein [Lentisphaeria bacterium]